MKNFHIKYHLDKEAISIKETEQIPCENVDSLIKKKKKNKRTFFPIENQNKTFQFGFVWPKLEYGGGMLKTKPDCFKSTDLA